MIKRFILVGLALLLTTVAWTSVAEDQFLFFEDLRVGMEGIGKTIIRGNEIRSFQARIVGLIDSPGELNDFIEIRVSGDVIRESGGVASGMSGSPIYVDGKLIGALSRAIAFDSDPSPFALVTPIGPMLELLTPARELAATQGDQARVINLEPARTSDAALQGYTQVELVEQLPPAFFRQEHPQRYYAVPIITPMLVSGMGGRAFDWFRSGIPDNLRASLGRWLLETPGRDEFFSELSVGLEDRYPIQMINTGLPGRQGAPIGSIRGVDDLVAGGSIGVTLADGDVTVGALGTVTYREDDVVLAFGHSFLFAGDVEYFLTRAYIYDTVANLQVPFKFGTTTDRMGTLLQDRFQGIAGVVGVKSKSVRMNVRLTNGETGEVSHHSLDLVRNDTFLASIVFSAGLSLLDTTLNRVGKGTLNIEYTIRGTGMPRRLERTDIFTSRNDIAVSGPLQVAQIVFLLSQNEFQDPQLDTIDVDMSFIPEVKAARLISLHTGKESYRPGETIRYTAKFLPFRGEPFEIEYGIAIPADVQANSLTLHVFGGPRPANSGDSGSAPVFEDLEEIIALVEKISRNDELTAELLGISSDDLDSNDQPYDVQRVNGWVVTGEERLTLTIEHEAEVQEEPAKETQGIGNTEQPEETDYNEETKEESGQSCDQLFFC